MLASIICILGIAPLVILAVALLAGGAVVSCAGRKDEDEDDTPPSAGTLMPDAALPPPPEAPQCEGFSKGESQYMVDQQSFDTMKILWGEDLEGANAENWDRHARIYFGATAHLFGVTCEEPSVMSGSTEEYLSSVKAFFENHYEEQADQSEDGMLVLIGGVAPETNEESAFRVALGTMAAVNQTQEEFTLLLEGCYHYNKATENAADRWSRPSGRKLSGDDKDAAREHMGHVSSIIQHFAEMDQDELDQALTDRQQELLFALAAAADSYGRTLKKGGRVVPPPPPPPKKSGPNPFKL